MNGLMATGRDEGGKESSGAGLLVAPNNRKFYRMVTGQFANLGQVCLALSWAK